MLAFWAITDFLTIRRLRSHDASERHLTPADRAWSKYVRGATGGLLALAILVSPTGILTGFCAASDGITFKRTPWTSSRNYMWKDVAGVTVVCHYEPGRYGGNYASYLLAMKDGAEIDLYETPRSFDKGYSALRFALSNVPLRYDDSQVLPNCNSALRSLHPIGSATL